MARLDVREEELTEISLILGPSKTVRKIVSRKELEHCALSGRGRSFAKTIKLDEKRPCLGIPQVPDPLFALLDTDAIVCSISDVLWEAMVTRQARFAYYA